MKEVRVPDLNSVWEWKENDWTGQVKVLSFECNESPLWVSVKLMFLDIDSILWVTSHTLWRLSTDSTLWITLDNFWRHVTEKQEVKTTVIRDETFIIDKNTPFYKFHELSKITGQSINDMYLINSFATDAGKEVHYKVIVTEEVIDKKED